MTHETRGSECPACQSTQITTIDRLPTSDIVSLYHRSGQLDVAQYFDGVHTIDLKRCDACDLRFYSPPCAGDGSFYEQLQKFDWYYEENKAEYGLARNHVPEKCKLLEVGCG